VGDDVAVPDRHAIWGSHDGQTPHDSGLAQSFMKQVDLWLFGKIWTICKPPSRGWNSIIEA
jgi:hypothetical protein